MPGAVCCVLCAVCCVQCAVCSVQCAMCSVVQCGAPSAVRQVRCVKCRSTLNMGIWSDGDVCVCVCIYTHLRETH